MFTLHCTKKLLDRIGHPVGTPVPASTRLGNWYATALFWKPQMALLVNERTLLPVVLLIFIGFVAGKAIGQIGPAMSGSVERDIAGTEIAR